MASVIKSLSAENKIAKFQVPSRTLTAIPKWIHFVTDEGAEFSFGEET